MTATQEQPPAGGGGLWQGLKRMLREAEQWRGDDTGEVVFVGDFAPALFVRSALPRPSNEEDA